MLKRPLISIIMPVYNAARYMDYSIDSILNQSLKDIELICVNDASTDGSLKKLKEYQKKDKRIKIVNNSVNTGPGVSRNNGIKKARGEFVCFVDSDDWLEKDACERLYKTAIKEKADVVFIKPKFVFTDKVVLDKRLLTKEDLKENKRVFLKTIRRKVAWAPWSKMVKKELIEKHKIYFPNIYVSEDMDFSYKVVYYAKKIAVEEKYLYNYFLHEGSLTSYSNAERRINNYFESIKLLKKFLKEKKIFEKLKNDFIYFKFYNYLAIWGVLNNTKEKFDKKRYKKILKEDPDFTIIKIISLKKFDAVIIGCFAIKFGLFSIGLKTRDFFRDVFGKWGKRY